MEKITSTGLGDLELGEVGHQVVGAVAEGLTGLLDHRLGGVDAEHPALREALEQLRRDASGAAAGVHHELVAGELEAVEHLEAPLVLRVGDAVVGLGVPLAGPGVHGAGRAHSEVVTGPGSARPAASNSSIASARCRVIATSSSPFSRRCLMSSSISNWKTPSAQLTVWSSRSMRASPAAATARQCSSSRTTGSSPFFVQLRIEDVRERGSDDGVEAVVLERPDGVLAGGARAEVPAR